MPTGYTFGVCDGTMTSAKEFLLNYAKRFGIGYFVTRQGELPMPKEYSPELIEKAVDDYHTKQLEKSKNALETFNNLSEQDLKTRYESYVADTQEENKKRQEANLERKKRYIDMINKVNEWIAPSGLEEMKTSAIQHLEESKEFDCRLYLDEICTYEKWLKAKKESLIWEVNYHTKEMAKENERKMEMDTMLKAFYKSLENID